MTLDDLCQATQSAPVEVEVESQSPDGPYRLCHAAADRLLRQALRPLEWFRLVAIHGPEYYLCSDFYDEDRTASQPRGEVVDAHLYPAPDVAAVQHDPEMLIAYAITRWSPGEPDLQAMRRLPRDVLAEAVKQRGGNTRSRPILERLYEICGRVLGRPMEDSS